VHRNVGSEISTLAGSHRIEGSGRANMTTSATSAIDRRISSMLRNAGMRLGLRRAITVRGEQDQKECRFQSYKVVPLVFTKLPCNEQTCTGIDRTHLDRNTQSYTCKRQQPFLYRSFIRFIQYSRINSTRLSPKPIVDHRLRTAGPTHRRNKWTQQTVQRQSPHP